MAGSQLFVARQAAANGGGAELLQPAIVSALVTDTGTPAPQVKGMNAAQQQAAQQTVKDLQDMRGGWFYQLATEKSPWALPVWFFQIPDVLNGSKPEIR